MGDSQMLRNLVGEESNDSGDTACDRDFKKAQGRHELHFHPLAGKRENKLSLNFGKSISSSTLKDNLSAIS